MSSYKNIGILWKKIKFQIHIIYLFNILGLIKQAKHYIHAASKLEKNIKKE